MTILKLVMLCTAVICAAVSIVFELFNKTSTSEMFMRIAYFLIVIELVQWRISMV